MADQVSQVSRYWQDVAGESKKIEATISRQKNQPNDGAVYIISLKPRRSAPDAREGVMSLANLKTAAMRCVEETHAVADDDQIAAYLAEQEKARQAVLGATPQGKSTLVFATPKELGK
jgi:hypothetical protein